MEIKYESVSFTCNIEYNYNRTQFYKSGTLLASGIAKVIINDKSHDIQVYVIKINDTNYLAQDIIDSAQKCRQLYRTDTDMYENYREEITPEEFCVTLVTKIESDYHTLSYITDDLLKISDVRGAKFIRHQLPYYIKKLFSK